jgi:hypothetical protein
VPEPPPAVAVSVTVCVVLTPVAVAENPALHDPDGGVTEAGTVTALLLLPRTTVSAPDVCAVKVTVHQTEPAPVTDAGVQERPFTDGCPVPLSAIVPPLVALLLIVTVPLAAPATVGSNPTVSVAVCPGFNVNGVLIPVAENPAPLTATPLIVSAAVPEDVTVTSCVVAMFSPCVPNATFVVLRLRPGTAAFSCIARAPLTPPSVAVSVAVCSVVTDEAVAVNAALEAPAATVTDAGTVTALLLLARLTVRALAVAPVSVTVHASVTAPVSDALLHVTPLTAGCPVPLSAIVPPLVALLPIVTVPLAAPATVGSNPTVSVAVCPGFNVNGTVMPVAENPAPLTATPLIVSAAVPDDVTVTACVVAAFSNSVPNATLVELRLRPGTAAFSCNAKVPVTPPAVADTVAVCAVVTAEADAINPALDAPVATVTEAGTVTALLVLVRLTGIALGVAPVSVTVQLFVTAPVSEALAQDTALSAGCPAPLSAIVPPLVALLLIVTVPLAAPATVGSNPTVSVAVCPGFNVNGVLIPDTENPAPLTATPLIVSTVVPDDVTVTDCVVAAFSSSVPNATLVVLRLRPATAAFSCNAKEPVTPPAVAVSVAVCAVLTDAAVAVNPALEAPAATVTDAGTVTALLLLAKLTVRALAVAPVSVTVQASVATPVSDPLLHVTPLTAGCPVPLSAIVARLALLVIVAVPLAAPATVGSNPTVSVAV